MTTDVERLVMRGAARENDAHDEAKAESGCNYGVGCTGNLCYAKAHGYPHLCGREEVKTAFTCLKCFPKLCSCNA